LEVLLIDGDGRLLTRTEAEVITRQSGWNIGIKGIEDNGDDIVILFQRSNQQVLGAATCYIELKSGDWAIRNRVDLNASFIPRPSYARPPVSTGSEISVKIGCDAPWDVDDDPSDDNSSIYLSALPVAGLLEGSIWYSIAAAMFVLAGLWLAGFILPRPQPGERKGRARTESGSRRSRKSGAGPKKSTDPESENEMSPDEGDAGLHLDADDEESGSSAETTARSKATVDSDSRAKSTQATTHSDDVGADTVGDTESKSDSEQAQDEVPLDEFEARLARLRGRFG
jgi:hypothetical protein